MSNEEAVAVQETEAPKVKANMTPQEFLASLPAAPTAEQIALWKSQAPNNRVQVFSPDGKRAYIMRGLTGMELTQIQKQLQGMATAVSDPDLELQILSVCKAVVWTNSGVNGRLTDTILRTGTAGLPSTLFAKVTNLSDFMEPQQIEMLSADL